MHMYFHHNLIIGEKKGPYIIIWVWITTFFSLQKSIKFVSNLCRCWWTPGRHTVSVRQLPRGWGCFLMMRIYKPNMKVKHLGQGYRRAQISHSLHAIFRLPIWSPEHIRVPQTFALHSTFCPLFENSSFIHGWIHGWKGAIPAVQKVFVSMYIKVTSAGRPCFHRYPLRDAENVAKTRLLVHTPSDDILSNKSWQTSPFI